jgi:hypothetical protein
MSDPNFETLINQINDNYFDYHSLESFFNDLLTKKLRKHEISKKLELWVPESNIPKGIIGLIESIHAVREKYITIKVLKQYANSNLIEIIKSNLNYVDEINISETNDENHKEIKINLQLDDKQNFIEVDDYKTIKTKNKISIPKTASQKYFNLSINEKNFFLNDFLGLDNNFFNYLKNCSNYKKFYKKKVKETNFTASIENLDVSMNIEDDGKIIDVTFSGLINELQIGMLESFFPTIINLPIQEAFEHGNLKHLNTVIKNEHLDFKKGITLPINCGSMFLLPKTILKIIFSKFIQKNNLPIDYNFFYYPPTKQWNDSDQKHRFDLVLKQLSSTLQSEGMEQDDIKLENILENRNFHYTRCVFSFSDYVNYSRKPELLRSLESNIKRHIDESLEVFAVKRKDTSPLRRLT